MYWLTGFLGVVSVIAPFVFNYTDHPGALWAGLGVGAVLIVTSFLEGMAEDKQLWEYWTAGIAGIAAILAPFVLGFYSSYAAVWTMVIIGFITVVAVGARLTEKSGLRY